MRVSALSSAKLIDSTRSMSGFASTSSGWNSPASHTMLDLADGSLTPSVIRSFISCFTTLAHDFECIFCCNSWRRATAHALTTAPLVLLLIRIRMMPSIHEPATLGSASATCPTAATVCATRASFWSAAYNWYSFKTRGTLSVLVNAVRMSTFSNLQ